jgi:predicted acyltransferase
VTRYCSNCGAELSEGAAFCPSCGSPVPGTVRVSATVGTGQTNGRAIASLVCGIGGLVLLPVVLSVLALVFGYQARRELRERPGEGGGGLATAGVVLGWIGVVWGGLIVLFYILAVASLSNIGG